MLAVVAHSSKQEPGAYVFVLLDVRSTDGTTIDVNQCEMAWKLTLVFGDKPPFRKLFSLSTFNEESANLVTTKLEPLHVVGQIQIELVAFGIGLKQFALSHQLLLFHSLVHVVARILFGEETFFMLC